MPYVIRKLPKKNCYRVRNKYTGRIAAYCTSRKKAERQIRLLEYIDNN